MPDDAAQQILTPLDADSAIKAQAWQAFKDSADENDFAKRIGGVNISQDVKAQLWEAKKSGATATGPSQSPGLNLPSNMSIGATPEPSDFGKKRSDGRKT